MKKLKIFLRIFCILFLISFCSLGARVWYILGQLPDDIYVLEGQNYRFDNFGIISPMFTLKTPVAEGGMVDSDGRVVKSGGKSTVSLLGVGVKDVNVNTVPKNSLIPCGMCVGVKLYANGIVVADRSDIESTDGKFLCPAKEAGIKKGDVIISVNGKITDSISDFELCVQNDGKNPLAVVYKRDGNTRSTTINAVIEKQSKEYKVGLLVRDSVAGIGTLTYYCPETKTYGALGHGIEADEMMFPGSDGTIEKAKIINIVKGRKGMPGEIQGAFTGEKEIATIIQNGEHGIFATTDRAEIDIKNAIPVASKDEVQKGAAHIICTVDGENAKEYSIEIEKISFVSTGGKAMIIRITDKKLIEKTGGIIQGMSGSPIIQNGKFVGAVTHVFVNDPTRGYGIFIENMLSESEKSG